MAPNVLGFKFPGIVKSAFTRSPCLQYLYRCIIIRGIDMATPLLLRHGPLNKALHSVLTSINERSRKRQLKHDPTLVEKLTPNSPLGCTRPGVSKDYYASFTLDNVKLITNEISEVREGSILTEDGIEEQVDMIILATGFLSQDFFAPMEIIGKNSVNILSKWKQNGPSGYLGILTHDMPNSFILLGPGSLAPNSLAIVAEYQVHFIIKALKEMMKRKAKIVAVKESVELEYMTQWQEKMKKLIFGHLDCSKANSWFVDSRKVWTGLYPGTALAYRKHTRSVNDSIMDYV